MKLQALFLEKFIMVREKIIIIFKEGISKKTELDMKEEVGEMENSEMAGLFLSTPTHDKHVFSLNNSICISLSLSLSQ